MRTYIGLGFDRSNCELFCDPGKVSNAGLDFWVINGAWKGRLKDGRITFVDSYDGDSYPDPRPMKILFQGTLPDNVARDYNAAIDYINKYIQKPWRFRSKQKFNVFKQRLVAAWRGWKYGWINARQLQLTDQYEDDDVAF